MKVHNAMEISCTLTEGGAETEDGEAVVAFFQKEERFKNYIPFTKYLMWDQTQCYGYNRREDGTCEVFHRGKNFYGPLPVRLLVQLHSYYVIWATEKHMNSPLFGTNKLEEQEHQRSNVPAYVFKDFVQRLSLALEVAGESGKIIAGSASTADAEVALKRLQRLSRSSTEAYVTTLKKSHLKRQMTRLEVSDPEAQAAANAAMSKLMQHPEVVKEKPRYGGSYEGR